MVCLLPGAATKTQYWGGIFYGDGIAIPQTAASNFNATAAIAPVTSNGLGGSTSRFTIAGNYLYALDSYNLDVLDISIPDHPGKLAPVTLTINGETIFPYQNKLFVGSSEGMSVYGLSNAEVPEKISQFSHVYGCDPVIAQGNYAYVTDQGRYDPDHGYRLLRV